MITCRAHFLLAFWATVVVSWPRVQANSSQVWWSSCWSLVLTSGRLSVTWWVDSLIVVVWVSTCTLGWKFRCFRINGSPVVICTCQMWVSCIIVVVHSTITSHTRSLVSWALTILRHEIIVAGRVAPSIQLLLVAQLLFFRWGHWVVTYRSWWLNWTEPNWSHAGIMILIGGSTGSKAARSWAFSLICGTIIDFFALYMLAIATLSTGSHEASISMGCGTSR